MQFRGKQVAAATGAVAAAIALAACSSSSSSSSSAPAASSSSPAAAASASSSPSATSSASTSSVSGTISGAGSTFQTNFQQGAISAFKSVDPSITVNYNSVGSGTGRDDLAANTVLYAGSDSPIPSTDAKDFKKPVLYFPVQIGPVAIAYNVSGVTGLKLDATLLAEIFSGKITTWNDPAIKALNPSLSLPSASINLEVRSDSSGTTANFSQYLVDAAGSDWTLGTSSIISWPKSAHANDGGSAVAAAVKSTSDSIGYVDFSTATATGLVAASIKNAAGDFVAPSSAAAAAAATHVTPKSNLTFLTVDEPGATSYPITYQSWDIVYKTQPNATDVSLLQAYLGYLLGAGQSLLTPLNLAPLPPAIDAAAKAQLSQITS
jgi:phosphate transport system substrate-binding protein